MLERVPRSFALQADSLYSALIMLYETGLKTYRPSVRPIVLTTRVVLFVLVPGHARPALADEHLFDSAHCWYQLLKLKHLV